MSESYEEYPSLYPTISEESIKENSKVESKTINLEEFKDETKEEKTRPYSACEKKTVAEGNLHFRGTLSTQEVCIFSKKRTGSS